MLSSGESTLFMSSEHPPEKEMKRFEKACQTKANLVKNSHRHSAANA